MRTRNESFSDGFDHGNYGNAYESQDWGSWYADNCTEPAEAEDPDAYRAGMLLGFFSSYELHEIPADIADDVEQLRAEWGED